MLTACGTSGSGSTRGNEPILLFTGAGTSSGDVAALKTILDANRLDYATADSSRLNGWNESQFRTYRLLIVPGGNFIDMGNGLTAVTSANIRSAVRHGLNYLGICAGGFLAGKIGANSLDLASGVKFGFYAAEAQGTRKAAVRVSIAGSEALDHYWEDGPQFTGWGTVVGKYPDGTPAVVEGAVGSGWMILSGVHPEAPESWRRGLTFQTPASVDNAYAATLIRAALDRVELPHY